ncbi:MAG: 30S ribosomal protein S15 [Chloroherpetonaceae bacterium]|nr:30S ribosomal protein S15 [Chloroherpetonaceae bacterium]
MAVTKTKKTELITKHGGKPENTGSSEAQIALLTEHINDLTKHVTANPNDNHSRYGLFKLVGKRKRLLSYLTKVDVIRYRKIIAELEIRK